MDLITPHIGLLFWTLISFSFVLFILGKAAWKPIVKALKERELSIDSALKSAELARNEMSLLQIKNEKIIADAKKERDALIKEAKGLKDQIITEAREQANMEAKKLIDVARQNFQNEKVAAMNEIKNQIAKLSVEVAEKILKEKLSDYKDQKDTIHKFMKDIKLS